MPNCWSIDPLITPYVDGELPAADRQTVEQHMRGCTPCRARIATEQAVRDLVGASRSELTGAGAPLGLRARCTAKGGPHVPAPLSRLWSARLTPLALAATLAIVVGGAFLYPLTGSSSRLMAAELTVDHMKCFLLNAAIGTHDTEAAVRADLGTSFDWRAAVSPRPQPGQRGAVGGG